MSEVTDNQGIPKKPWGEAGEDITYSGGVGEYNPSDKDVEIRRLQDELLWYKEVLAYHKMDINKLHRQLSAQKGLVTRYKNKLKKENDK